MKKSLVAVMLGLMMTVSLVGCGGCGTETEESTEAKIVSVEVEVLDAPTEEVETEVVEEVAEEATEVSEEPAVEETTAVEEVSPYSYTELNQVMYAQSTVNVRDLPEQTGGKVGSLSTNQEVTVTGQCNETGWYRISYNGGEGFVSNSYLGAEKVAVQSSQSKSSSQAESQPAQEAPAAEAPAQEAPAESADPYEVDENGVVWRTDGQPTAPGETLEPDVVYCWYCDATFSTKDEMVAHTLEVHGVEFPY